MTLLTIGLLIWVGVHFIPSMGLHIKRAWIDRLGDKGYRLSFSALIVLSLVLIVFGWRSTAPSFLYALPEVFRPISLLLMLVAFILFGAAKHATRIKKFVRHPQLCAVILWSIAHLLTNGDTRSVLLFGSLGVWAVAEIFLINRREGAWIKPDSPSWGQEAKGMLLSLAIFAVIVFAHPYIAGVPVR